MPRSILPHRDRGRGGILGICWVVLSALAVPSTCARAQATLTSAIWHQYNVVPTVPFVAFDPDSTDAPVPGAAIGNISQHSQGSILVYDLSAAVICSPREFSYPKLRGTQGFRQSFSATYEANRTELKLLFAFDDKALSAIRTYEVTLSSASFLTIPFNQLLNIKTQVQDDPRCSGFRPTKTISKPIVADVGFVFQLTHPFSPETEKRLRESFAAEQSKGGDPVFKLSMPHRLVALGIID